jgi:hypothetical protein
LKVPKWSELSPLDVSDRISIFSEDTQEWEGLYFSYVLVASSLEEF